MDMKKVFAESGLAEGQGQCGTHLCLIYNSESERRKAMAKFIESGIRNGEHVVYLADRVTETELASLLEELGIDVEGLIGTGGLEVRKAEDAYCPAGNFTPENMLDVLRAVQMETGAAGYPYLRVTGEMTWALRGIRGSEKLIEYESKINELMVSHPFLAVCQYDARLFNGGTLYHVLQVHPFMIVKGQVMENPFHIRPKEFNRRQ